MQNKQIKHHENPIRVVEIFDYSIDKTEAVLQSKACTTNINEYDINCQTRLHRAVLDNNLKVAKFLINAGVDVNQYSYLYANFNGKGLTPLMATEDEKMIDLLLENGADINKLSQDKSNTAVGIAAHSGETALAKLLIEKGADVNVASNTGHTALMRASFTGDEEMVAALLEAGADYSAISKDGDTAEDMAELNEYYDIVDQIRAFAKMKEAQADNADLLSVAMDSIQASTDNLVKSKSRNRL